MFSIAIVGKANVGKSSLFNLLARKKLAIKHDRPGITRDRKEAKITLFGHDVVLIDTAGLEYLGQDRRFKYETPLRDHKEAAVEADMHKQMIEQSISAIKMADCVLFVIDGKHGVAEEDYYFAQIARRNNKHILLVINKSENDQSQISPAEYYKFGFGEPIHVSAEHNLGIGEILTFVSAQMERVSDRLNEEDRLRKALNEEDRIHVAIIGRPNTGKSTLMNAMLGEDRVITGDKAGITRDAISVDFTFFDTHIKLIDTAGIRKSTNKDGIEKLSVHESMRSMRLAHVVLIMVDATMPFPKQDIKIACEVIKEFRIPIIVINKWDLLADHEKTTFKEDIKKDTSYLVPGLVEPCFVYISAKTSYGFANLHKSIVKLYDNWNTRIKTSALNKWCELRLKQNPPPYYKGRSVKIKYITQIKTRPPAFIVFASNKDAIKASYIRYISNSIAKDFNLTGIPFKVEIRDGSGSNPYSD